MAKSKVKEAKVPLKGETKKKAPKASETARAKPSHLSEEVVLESGSESDSGSSGGGSDTESEDDKRQNTKKPDVRKVAATEPTEPAVPDDTSSEEEDSEEASDEDKTQNSTKASKKPPKGKSTTNGTKRKADESSSEEDGSADELPDAPAAKKARSESEESEEEDNAGKMDVDKPTLPPGIVASSVPAQPFEPPSGYLPMDTKSRSAVSGSALKGKQIWHITAPVDLPISSLHEVALDAAQSNKPVMSHRGIDYILSEDKGNGESGTAVLLPDREGYAPVQQPIARTMHLKQHIVLPNLSDKQADQLTGSNTAGDAATAAVTAIRPQPRGLRMRYRPPGFGLGNPGRIGSGSESEAEEARPVGNEAVFQFPKKPEVSGKDKKERKEKKDKKEKRSKAKS